MPSKKKFILRITDALFKSSLNKNAPTVFINPIKNLQINPHEKWVLWGSGKSKLIDILSNKYLCEPSRAFQFNKPTVPRIEQVQFKGAIPTAHLSARYEFYKDEFDQTCKQFILDNAIGSRAVNYTVETTYRQIDQDLYRTLIDALQLKELEDRWAMGLSNGQMRRARLARSMLKKPDLLLIDDPFLGLDPTASSIISQFLSKAYDKIGIPVIIGLRYQDPIPKWCTHVCCVDDTKGVIFNGPIEQVQPKIDELRKLSFDVIEQFQSGQRALNRYSIMDLLSPHPMFGKDRHDVFKMPSSIEFNGVNVTYRGQDVLRDLKWDVKKGSKWHIQGNNGSGKSTLLSMIVAEHPQSWNSKVIENGVPRKTGNASYFDINKRIGMSSPELHAIFSKKSSHQLTVKECIASGFHEGSSNNFRPMWKILDDNKRKIINIYLEYFGLSDISDTKHFDQLSLSEQKLILFIRSLVKMPDVLILDEAFSGMEVEPMLRCHELLESWPGTVLVVAHVEEETPKCNHFIRLISPGKYSIGDIEN